MRSTGPDRTAASRGRRRPRLCGLVPPAAALAIAAAAAGPAVALGYEGLPAPGPLTFFVDWTFDPILQAGLLAVTALYLLAVYRIDLAHPSSPVPWTRVAAFLAGIAVVEIALQSGIGTYDDTLFSVHMVQHMLLMFVAAPLLVLGAPMTVLLRAVRSRARHRVVLPVLHSRVVRLIGHPLVAWLLFTTVMYASHLSPLFDLALQDDLVHRLEHALFLGSAILFWWPVVGIDPGPFRVPYPLRALYLFLQFPLMSFLSLAIYAAPASLYAHYADLGRPWGPTPLADQQAAGAIMWVWGDLTFLVAIVLVVAAWLNDEEARATREEARQDARRTASRELEERPPARLTPDRGGEPPEGG